MNIAEVTDVEYDSTPVNLFRFFLRGEHPQLATRGEGFLIRWPVGMVPAVAERLGPEGDWVGDASMVRSDRGNPQIFTEITRAQATEVATAWASLGKVPKVAVLDEVDPGGLVQQRIALVHQETRKVPPVALTPQKVWRYFLAGKATTVKKMVADPQHSSLCRLPIGAHPVFAEVAPSGRWWIGTHELKMFTREQGSRTFIEIDRAQAEQIARNWASAGHLESYPDLDGAMSPVVAEFVHQRLAENGFEGSLVISSASRPTDPRFDWAPAGAPAGTERLNLQDDPPPGIGTMPGLGTTPGTGTRPDDPGDGNVSQEAG